MATIAVPSECIDLELTFGVKYERSQILFMNVCCNWNEQMLQYCATVFNNRLSCAIFLPYPVCSIPRFLSFSSAGSSLLLLLLPTVFASLPCYISPPSFSPPDSVLCAVAVLSD